jgi:uncharacterized integral membrane protein
MTEPAGPHGMTSTLPPPSANGAGRSTPAPHPGVRARLHAPISGMRTAFIAGLAALTVMVIFIIQNVHAANISFLGVHLVLPLAGALLLAAIAGSLLTVAAGPARIAQLRQAMGRSLRKARAGMTAPDDRVLPGPGRRARPGPGSTIAFSPGHRPASTRQPRQPPRVTD